MTDKLQVSEIYRSIQGEGTRVGQPCLLVRLAGCNLSCRWCDTRYAATEQGREMSIEEVLAEVSRHSSRMVMLTGGEPLMQTASLPLLEQLCDLGKEVVLMTNGSCDISAVDARVIRCIDVKCPLSGESESMLWSNLDCLCSLDEAKFVIAGRTDYDYAAAVCARYRLPERCTVIFSPAYGLLEPGDLANWILQDGLEVRVGVQLHKVIWPGSNRGV